MRSRLLAILRAIRLAWVAVVGWGPRRARRSGCGCAPPFAHDLLGYAGGCALLHCRRCGTTWGAPVASASSDGGFA